MTTTPMATEFDTNNLTQEQLHQFESLIERETSRAYDAVADGVWEACADFLSSLGVEFDRDADRQEALDELAQLVEVPNFSVDGLTDRA